MSSGAVKYEAGSMHDVVGSEKSTVLNSGVVKNSRGQSLSTLTEVVSAASAREAANASSAANRVGGKCGTVSAGASKTSETAAGGVSGNAADPVNGSRKLSVKKLGISKAVHELDEAPEFEGVGDAYDKGMLAKGGYKKAKSIKDALKSGQVASKGKAASSASAKGKAAADARKAKGAAGTAKRAASKGSAAQALATKQAAAKASEAAAANVAKSGALKAIGAAISSAAAPIAGVLAGILAFVLSILVIAQLLSALFGFWENEYLKSTGQLTGVEQEIAAALKGYGFTNEATAAILGNLKAESGMNPSSDEVMDGMFNYAYERACGLFQYTSTSPGSGEYWVFKNWCSANGKEWSAVSSQMEWTFSGNCEGTWSNRWSTGLARSGYYSNCPGYVDGSYYTAAEFPSATDVVKATFSWMACYERPANGQYAHLDRRIEYAKDYLAKLTADTYSGDNAIVAAAYSQLGVPYVWGGSTPGVGLDCSGLTQYCYAQAGISIPRTSSEQFAALTAIPISQALPGDILYTPGHVAIYIGGDEYIHEPDFGLVCSKSSGINYFTCALRHT